MVSQGSSYEDLQIAGVVIGLGVPGGLAHVNGGSPRYTEIVRYLVLVLSAFASRRRQTPEVSRDLADLIVGSSDRRHHRLRIMLLGIFDLFRDVLAGSPGTDAVEDWAGRAALAFGGMTCSAVEVTKQLTARANRLTVRLDVRIGDRRRGWGRQTPLHFRWEPVAETPEEISGAIELRIHRVTQRAIRIILTRKRGFGLGSGAHKAECTVVRRSHGASKIANWLHLLASL